MILISIITHVKLLFEMKIHFKFKAQPWLNGLVACSIILYTKMLWG